MPNSPTGRQPETAADQPQQSVQQKQQTPKPPKSLSRRIARRILGPTLMLKRD